MRWVQSPAHQMKGLEEVPVVAGSGAERDMEKAAHGNRGRGYQETGRESDGEYLRSGEGEGQSVARAVVVAGGLRICASILICACRRRFSTWFVWGPLRISLRVAGWNCILSRP